MAGRWKKHWIGATLLLTWLPAGCGEVDPGQPDGGAPVDVAGDSESEGEEATTPDADEVLGDDAVPAPDTQPDTLPETLDVATPPG
jgi:hypothetical protein